MSVMLVLQAKYHCFYGLLLDIEFLAGFVNSVFSGVWRKEMCDITNHWYTSDQFSHLKAKECHNGNIVKKSNMEHDC